ncbi:MAG TPA: hypothetical protein ENN21_09905, partial [Spirochaetes bacterium]|nr:hypothetical protein [Spirochaetota bacterium]
MAFAVLALIMVAPPVRSLRGQDDGQSPFRLNVFMDRSSFSVDDPVMLHLIVRNFSDRKEYFVVYDELYTTYQPVVYTGRGREAEIIVPHRLKGVPAGELIRDRVPRIVELMPNETFVSSINLKEVYALEKDTEYRVKGFFTPDFKSPLTLASDNELRFKITRSPDFVPRSGIARVNREVSPSEVVLLALTAEKEGNWGNYLKYIKSDIFINAYPEYV